MRVPVVRLYLFSSSNCVEGTGGLLRLFELVCKDCAGTTELRVMYKCSSANRGRALHRAQSYYEGMEEGRDAHRTAVVRDGVRGLVGLLYTNYQFLLHKAPLTVIL